MNKSDRMRISIIGGLIFISLLTLAAYLLANSYAARTQSFDLEPKTIYWVGQGVGEGHCDPNIYYSADGQLLEIPVDQYSGPAPLFVVNADRHPSLIPQADKVNPSPVECPFLYEAPRQLGLSILSTTGQPVYPLEIQFDVTRRIRAGESVLLTTTLSVLEGFSDSEGQTTLVLPPDSLAILDARIYSPNLIVTPESHQKQVNLPLVGAVSEEQWVIGSNAALRGSQVLIVYYKISTTDNQVFEKGASLEMQVSDVYGLNPFITAGLTAAGSLTVWILLVTTNVFGLVKSFREKPAPPRPPGPAKKK